jgi:hypothetical protein
MSESIDGLLTESGMQGDDHLRELLDELERDSIAVRPIPSAELAALLTRRPSPRRVPRSRTAVITGIVVVGVMGLGAGAAAASPSVRSVIGSAVGAIVDVVAPGADIPWLDSNDNAEKGPVTGAKTPEGDPDPATTPTASDPTPVDNSHASTTGSTNGVGHSDDHEEGVSDGVVGVDAGSNAGNSGNAGTRAGTSAGAPGADVPHRFPGPSS